jgi:prepilin-type N-terminal cleavage/methylation domain-containing protein
MKKTNTLSSGFTLVEIAIVLTIIGVMLGSGVLALTGALNDIRYRTTRDRMNGVANALAVYAQQNMFMPCPAVPPDANGRTTGFARATCAGVDSRGIVPYATLGLTVEQVQDSYGNYLSYAVNQNLATNAIQAPALQVLQECRTNNIWFVTGQNRNPRKARFCCFVGNTTNDLIVQNVAAGTPVGTPTVLTTARNTGTNGTITTGVDVTTPQNTQTPAFVLISHGRNGLGAYRPSAAPARYTDPSGATYRTNEIENANDDNVYVSATYSTNQDNTVRSYFDDVVVWRTQDQLLSTFGRDSCARP